MNRISKVLAAAALSTAMAMPLLAQSSTPPPSVNDASGASSLLHHPRLLARFLGLSKDQTTSLLGFWSTLEQTVEPLRQAREPLCQQLRTDLAVATPDPATVGTDAINLFDSKQQIAAARSTFDTSFSAILNPSELAQYDSLKKLAWLGNPEYNAIGECPPAG
ncbi:MAG: hypothetical protein M3O15_14520 [Acidobacteriota bacterium]|nr:hypothetical protein [Acidobacteriota bacterium]